MSRHPVIGLTGLPCTGKSFVGGILVGLGAAVLHTDQLGHAVLEEPDIKAKVAEHFGPEALDADGRVDRAAVGRRVFAHPPPGADARAAGAADRNVPPELAWLENLTHPRIRARARAWIAARRVKQPVVVEAALLVQSGLAPECDVIVVLEADDRIRRERAGGHRQWTGDMLAARDRRLAGAIADLRDPERRRALGLDARVVFLRNDGRADATRSMDDLVVPLRALIASLEA